jgi:alpha,alpha-trehalose phosphorylase
VEEGEEITVAVLGSRVHVTSMHPVTVALDSQGPRIPGVPEAIALRGTLRADGTVITASVPHHSGRNQ